MTDDQVPPQQDAAGRLDSFEVHPRASVGLDRAGGVLGIAMGGFFTLVLFSHNVRTSNGGDILTALAVVGAVCTIGALYGRHYLHTNKLYVTPTAVGHLTALLSRPRDVPRDRVARVVHADVSPWWSRNDLHYLLVVGADGRCLMRWDCMYYGEEDMRAFARAIGVPYERGQREFRLSRLQKQIPGALPLFIRHPFPLMLAGLAAVAALVAVGVAIWGAVDPGCCGS